MPLRPHQTTASQAADILADLGWSNSWYNQRPLAGLRVLDFTRAGRPFATRILADMGADVVKIIQVSAVGTRTTTSLLPNVEPQ